MVSDSLSSTPSEPKQCSNGCDFYGSAETRGLCSSCFAQDQAVSATMVSDSSSSTPSEPKQCSNGCDFYGSAETRGLCSSCFAQDQAVSATSALDWLSINDEISAPSSPELIVPSPVDLEVVLSHLDKFFAQDQAVSATEALDWLSIPDEISTPCPPALVLPSPAAAEVVLPPQDRCHTCDKRVKIGRGFNCRCGFYFCRLHRYPEEHKCQFDYKAKAKLEIMKSNPKIKADKIERI